MNSCTDETFPVTETAVAPVAPSAVAPATPTTVIPIASSTVDPSTTTSDAPIRTTSVTPVTPITNATIYSYNTMEIETMDLINNYRVSIGLKALTKTNYISYKSEEHNKYMIANNVVNHDGFDARSEDIMKVLGAKSMVKILHLILLLLKLF